MSLYYYILFGFCWTVSKICMLYFVYTYIYIYTRNNITVIETEYYTVCLSSLFNKDRWVKPFPSLIVSVVSLPNISSLTKLLLRLPYSLLIYVIFNESSTLISYLMICSIQYLIITLMMRTHYFFLLFYYVFVFLLRFPYFYVLRMSYQFLPDFYFYFFIKGLFV